MASSGGLALMNLDVCRNTQTQNECNALELEDCAPDTAKVTDILQSIPAYAVRYSN